MNQRWSLCGQNDEIAIIPNESLFVRISFLTTTSNSVKYFRKEPRRSINFKLSLHWIITCIRLAGNLGEESSKQGDHVSGSDDPGGETDDDCLEEGARTETDEPGYYFDLYKSHA